MGWNVMGEVPTGIKKAIVIAAPHTSAMDFVYGRCGFAMLGVSKVKLIVKKEMFRFPMGIAMRAFGAIPVDRGKGINMIGQATKMFNESDHLFLMITPEGTRKYTEHWKKGFYQIAQKANVPIIIGFLDYGKKECGFASILYPSGDFEKDFKTITDFYKTKTARYPKDFNLSEMYQKENNKA